MHGLSGEVCWGVGGDEGSCGKRYGGCRGRYREVCWSVGMSKEKYVGSVGRGVGKYMG